MRPRSGAIEVDGPKVPVQTGWFPNQVAGRRQLPLEARYLLVAGGLCSLFNEIHCLLKQPNGGTQLSCRNVLGELPLRGIATAIRIRESCCVADATETVVCLVDGHFQATQSPLKHRLALPSPNLRMSFRPNGNAALTKPPWIRTLKGPLFLSLWHSLPHRGHETAFRRLSS
jgi:hypothetical protein